MKIALCAAAILGLPFSLIAAGPDSAYQALRTVGAQRGGDSLKHVIELEGHGGVPQPAVWRVVLDDPSAQGGVRVLDVSHGRIVGEHTPIREYGGSARGAVIDVSKLNLDSSGAFTVAEREAQKAHIGFDSVDYTLRTGDGPAGTPVWIVHMMDASGQSIGSLSVAADTGSIVSRDLSGRDSEPPPYVATGTQQQQPPPGNVADLDNVYTPSTQPAPPPPNDQDTDPDDTQDTHGLRIGHRIKQAFMSAGESLKNFVTGQSSDH